MKQMSVNEYTECYPTMIAFCVIMADYDKSLTSKDIFSDSVSPASL